MIIAVLICLAILILITSWIIYRRNIELFLCLLIVIYSEFFYLVPQIKGPDDFKLLLLPILLVLFSESVLNGKLALGRYGWWMICFLVISFLGVIVAMFRGQSLVLGLKAAKFVPLALVYFLLVGRQINTERFIKYFLVMSVAVATIAAVQYFVHDSINLFPGLPKSGMMSSAFERSVTYRNTVGQYVIPAAAAAAFARYYQSARLPFLFVSIALFLEVIFISQTRMLIAALFLGMVVVYALSNRLTLFKVVVYLSLFSVILLSLSLFPISDFEKISLIERTSADLEKRGGSLQARINAYEYYWQEIWKRPLVGHGILNFNWPQNPERTLQRKKAIHFSDIGVIHFFVQSGIAGFVWFIYGLFRLWSDILQFRRQLPLSAYVIVGTFAMPTIDIFLRDDTLFLFTLFLGIFAGAVAVKADPVPRGTL